MLNSAVNFDRSLKCWKVSDLASALVWLKQLDDERSTHMCALLMDKNIASADKYCTYIYGCFQKQWYPKMDGL